METLPHENDSQPEEPSTVVQERKDMFCYVNGSGQLVFDKHPSDQEHVQAPATNDTQPLYDCRLYLTDLFPKEWIGKRGVLRVSRVSTSKRVVVSLTFVPEETKPTPAP